MKINLILLANLVINCLQIEDRLKHMNEHIWVKNLSSVGFVAISLHVKKVQKNMKVSSTKVNS